VIADEIDLSLKWLIQMDFNIHFAIVFGGIGRILSPNIIAVLSTSHGAESHSSLDNFISNIVAHECSCRKSGGNQLDLSKFFYRIKIQEPDTFF
jgi:hypothetical protein